MKPENLETIYELTPTQQGILFHALMKPEAGMYVVQLGLTLEGNLDLNAFQTAWEQVICRHAILRTGFQWEGLEKPLQVVRRRVPLSVSREDWRSKAPSEQQAALAAYLQRDAAVGFDLTQPPLMRLSLIQLADATYRFVWSKHHLILDGWSTGIVLKEVFAGYEALSKGQVLNLPPASAYGDYIAWLQQQNLSQAETFWREHLQGFSAPTPLPVEATAAEGREASEIRFSQETTATLQTLARQQQLTLNTIVQGAWALLLSRYSSEMDVVFGATSAGRPASLPGSESMVGVLIGTLPVRTSVSPEAELLAYLHQLQLTQASSRQYEYAPLVSIQGWSDVPRHLPLFESLVVFENYPLDTSLRQRRSRLDIRDVQTNETTNYPLTLIVLPESDAAPKQLTLKLAYDRERFSEATIARMLGHLQTILSGIAANPQQRLADLPLLTAAEEEQLLDWGRATAEFPQTLCLHEQFAAQVQKTPQAIALRYENRQLTYAELNQQANQLAHSLRRLGVRAESRVGLCVDRSLETVVGILGILKAGGAYVPLDPTYPSERLSFMLDDAGVSVLVTQQALVDRLPATDLPIIPLDGEAIARESQENLPPYTTPDNLAYIIYTSGSTGTPKGVLVPHDRVTRLFAATQAWFNFSVEDVWTLFHSYAFDFSVWEMWGALLYGGCLVVVPYWVSRLPEKFYDLLVTEGVTVLNQTPSAFRQLIQADAQATTSDALNLRFVIFGGEALDFQSLKPWFDRHGDEHPRLVNMYGITETTVHVTYRPIVAAVLEGNPGSVIGKPIPDLQVYILDRHQQLVPIGIPGELYVGGAGVARGYINRQNITQERFIVNPFSRDSSNRLYKTGDLARYLPNGEIEYLGRIDEQVKIRGFRIELGEIAAVLNQHPAVREAVVLARKQQGSDARLVAYIVSSPTPTTDELRRFLQARLPDYMVPAAFVPLEALPLTANGKIDRRQLPDPTSDRPDLSAAYIPPQTEIEQKIAAVWQEVLGVETVGVFDNFFDLGGNSLLAMQVYDRLREELRANLALVDLFRYPTVSALAQFFHRDEAEPTAPTPQTERLAAGKARLKQRLHQKKQAKTVQK